MGCSTTGAAGRAFDIGITHFDLANNDGSPPGSAEERSFVASTRSWPLRECTSSTEWLRSSRGPGS